MIERSLDFANMGLGGALVTVEVVGTYTEKRAAHSVATSPGSGQRPFLLRDSAPYKIVRGLRSVSDLPELVVDFEIWRNHIASSAAPTPLHLEDGMFTCSVDDWAASTVASLSGVRALSPSGFVRAADWSALAVLVPELASATDSRVLAFIPTDVAMLRPGYLETFLDMLAPLHGRSVAFLFASAGSKTFGSRYTLRGLRSLLRAHPGAWLVGVEPLVALDAVAHGAGRAFVGTQSSLRFPSPPGTAGYAPSAAGFIPGLLHLELLEMRSPSIYADWYISSPSPRCAICLHAVDGYTPADASKAAIREHNLHAMSAATTMLYQLAGARGLDTAAHQQRVEALAAHIPLMPRVAVTDIDRTLKNLVYLDRATYQTPEEVRRLL